MKFLAALLLCFSLTGCFLLRPPPNFEAVEQQIAELREWRDKAIKAGVSAEIVMQIDALLFKAQDSLAQMREQQPTNWLDLGLIALTTLAGGGLLGAKMAGASKWIHSFRSVVKGIDNFKGKTTPEVVFQLETALRGTMNQKDKDSVKEARE